MVKPRNAVKSAPSPMLNLPFRIPRLVAAKVPTSEERTGLCSCDVVRGQDHNGGRAVQSKARHAATTAANSYCTADHIKTRCDRSASVLLLATHRLVSTTVALQHLQPYAAHFERISIPFEGRKYPRDTKLPPTADRAEGLPTTTDCAETWTRLELQDCVPSIANCRLTSTS